MRQTTIYVRPCYHFVSTTLLFFLSISFATSQSIELQIIESAGGNLKHPTSSHSLQFSIGEPIAGAVGIINQGFIQSTADIISSSFEPELLNQIHVYPNPTSDYIIVSNEKNEDLMLIISNLQGQLIRYHNMTSSEEKLYLKDIPPGPYLLTVSNEKGSALLKFIKSE